MTPAEITSVLDTHKVAAWVVNALFGEERQYVAVVGIEQSVLL